MIIFAKYIDGQSQMLIPAPLDTEAPDRIREAFCRHSVRLKVTAFHVWISSFASRMERQAINEVNTMPGFTPYSMYPLLWRETGVSYAELLDRMIELGLERYNRKQALNYENGVQA